MNHARCPACHTLFRVTAEQLEARGGRVRCGQCANVFNALESLLVPEVQEPAAFQQEPDSYYPVDHDLDLAPKSESLPAVLVSNRREPETVAPYQETESLEAEAREHVEFGVAEEIIPATGDLLVLGLEDNQHYEPDASGEAAVSVVPEEAEVLTPIAVDWHEGEHSPIEVVPVAPAPAGQGNSRLWGAALGLLVLAAALQITWVFRSDLAMAYPELRPQFVAWCQDLGCDMPLPRQSGQIGIEASELRPASQGQGLLKLSATLRNRAAFPQAYPDLELTLTDTEDKALVRRVFTPKEFLGAKVDQAAGFSANGDLPISLTLDTSAISAAGYRLYVFYP
jgi:predicted Zn finger-like uncharacterized protein